MTKTLERLAARYVADSLVGIAAAKKDLLDIALHALNEVNEKYPDEHIEYMVAKMGAE